MLHPFYPLKTGVVVKVDKGGDLPVFFFCVKCGQQPREQLFGGRAGAALDQQLISVLPAMRSTEASLGPSTRSGNCGYSFFASAPSDCENRLAAASTRFCCVPVNPTRQISQNGG